MLDLIKNSWEDILLKMKNDFEISDIAFNTWVLKLFPYALEDDLLYVIYDSMTIGPDYLNKKYKEPLEICVSEAVGENITVIITPLEQIQESKPQPEENKLPTSVNLNPKYTFDTFVVGSNNEYAHATCLAVAEDPGSYFNPLFIYGGVGLGKTHLMHSIAYHVLSMNSSANILYVTSEMFTTELISAIKNKNTEAFKDKYRNVDMLLIDDIQFIAGKESTQEEFFHTFNTLYERKKQIVISSDKPPRDIEGMEERLVSRFKVGISVDVQPPNYETRVAILKNKAEMDHLNLDMDCLHYIAENIHSNIRELEGALNQVNNYSKFHNIRNIDLETVSKALYNVINQNEKKIITLDLILSVVADHYGVDKEMIKGKGRHSEIVTPRQVYMYLSKKYTDSSLQAIGDNIGGKDHSTVSYGAEQIENNLKVDANLRENIKLIVQKLNIS